MVKRSIARRIWKAAATTAFLCVIAILATSVRIGSAVAQSPALSEAQDINGVSGLVAEIVQCKRNGGVLSIRMRLRNIGNAEVRLNLISKANYDQYYVTAGSKKYFVLRDSERAPLANPINTDTYTGAVQATLPKGGSFVWYAKYPAPPGEVKKVNYYTPITAPFEDVPVSD